MSNCLIWVALIIILCVLTAIALPFLAMLFVIAAVVLGGALIA